MMLLATIKKDLLLLVRDRGALASLFLLPVVFIAVFGSIFGGGSDQAKLKLAIWVAPGDPKAAAISGAIDALDMYERTDQPDAAHVERASEDDADLGVVVPTDVGADHPVILYLDPGAPPQVSGPILGTLNGIVSGVINGPPATGEAKLIDRRAPPGKNILDDVTGFQITVPGNAVLFGFFLSLQVALSFVEERRTGTWRRLLASPINRRMILVAKLVPYFLVGLIQFAFLFGIGIVGFGMKVAGTPAALVAVTVCVVLCATALGLLIASLGGTEKQVGSVGTICLLVMGLVGGSMVPRVVMPPAMQTIGLFVPHGWALDAYFDVLVRPGTDVAAVAPQLAAMLGFAAAFFALGSLLFRFENS